MQKPQTIWKSRIFLGKRKQDNRRIYLSAPSWDCDWYWGFGYLGNSREHYHLEDYQAENGVKRNVNMRDALLEDYKLNLKIHKNLWVFCELSKTAYILNKAAKVYYFGSTNYTTNPCAEFVKNENEYRRINWVVLPKIFDTMHELFVK